MIKTVPLLIIMLMMASCNSTGKNDNAKSDQIKIEESGNMEKITYQKTGKIIRLDERINKIIPVDAEIEVLAGEFEWSEGPVWVSKGDYLLFSDVPENKVYKWKEGEGLSVYLEKSGYSGTDDYSNEPGSNGLMINEDNKLILCQHGNRQLAMMTRDLDEPAPVYKTLADNFNGKKLNSPNDLDIYKDGSIYFTDPPYGLPGRADSEIRELDFFGVYKVDPAGYLSLLTDQLSRPNGISFNEDYTKCYINVSDRKNPVIMSYNVNPEDGTLESETVFFDTGHLLSEGKGLPDGIKVHPVTGLIFSTGPGGVLILTPEGDHLGTVNTGYATANCCFDNDLEYLYMTADTYLMRVRLEK